MCSFTDKELSEFIQAKKRIHGTLEIKHAVAYVGKQANGYWVLNSELTVNEDGDRVSCEDSPYIWLGCMHDGRAIAKATDAVTVPLPLSTENIAPLLSQLRDILHHNFYPGVLVIAACTLALHYQTILRKFLNCPVPIAFGPSGTGKTTALRCGLATVGSYPNRLFCKGTKEKYLELCCQSSIPLGIDDPSFQKEIESLCIDLFNGAKSGSISRGEQTPCTTAVIAANFTSSTER